MLIKEQHEGYDSDYKSRRAWASGRYQLLLAEMLHKEELGFDMPCSYQISSELQWLIHYTSGQWSSVDRRLNDFNHSLHNTSQAWAGRQQPDGSWAPCTNVFFVKLSVSLEGITAHYENNTRPRYPLSFVATSALNASNSLIRYLSSLAVSRIASTGVNTRSELSNVITFVSRLVSLRSWVNTAIAGFSVSEDYAQAYLAFLDTLQDKTTGMWGAQYCDPVAQVVYGSNDLSLTFHVTKYRHGNISHRDKMAQRTLAFKNQPYPFGWGVRTCDNDRARAVACTPLLDDHNDFDVATLLSFAWDTLNATVQDDAKKNLQAFLNWTLQTSIRPLRSSAGRVMNCQGADSVGDCFYFAVGLLDVLGFWQPQKRFWTTSEFPEAPAVCCRLLAALRSLGVLAGIGLQARYILETSCPSCV